VLEVEVEDAAEPLYEAEVIYDIRGELGNDPEVGGGPVPVKVYASLVEEAGNVPVSGGGPVPVRVYVPDGAVVVGGGVFESGNEPEMGGGPVPVMV
jgi:hypothetical protein